MLALLAVGFMSYSCSEDDDNDGGGSTGSGSSTLEAPAFESVSAKYEITDGGDIQSIELTESGNYVIVTNDYVPDYDNGFFAHTRAGSSGTIFGKFIKISDTEFILEGFGSIVIEGDTNNAFSLQISENGKDPYVVGAEKIEAESNDQMTKKLCRTWDINKVNLKLYFLGKKEYDNTLPANQWDKLIQGLVNKVKEIEARYEDEEDEEDDDYYYDDDTEEEYILGLFSKLKPEQIIFTKAGSYMVTYEGEQLAISTWTWINSNKGLLRYSWNYDYIYDPEYSNPCEVNFNGKAATMYHSKTDEDEIIKISFKYFCTEAL